MTTTKIDVRGMRLGDLPPGEYLVPETLVLDKRGRIVAGTVERVVEASAGAELAGNDEAANITAAG